MTNQEWLEDWAGRACYLMCDPTESLHQEQMLKLVAEWDQHYAAEIKEMGEQWARGEMKHSLLRRRFFMDDFIKVNISGRSVTKAVKQAFGQMIEERIQALCEAALKPIVEETVDRLVRSMVKERLNLATWGSTAEEKIRDLVFELTGHKDLPKKIDAEIKRAVKEVVDVRIAKVLK